MRTPVPGPRSGVRNWLTRRLAAAIAVMTMLSGAPALAQAPMHGGILHLPAPYGSALRSLDPHATYESQDMVVSKALHRALYTWDSANNVPALDLAASVERSADGKTFTYKLLDNVYFHNGRKMTADDVIWSYTRVLDPAKGFPGATNLSHIEGADAYLQGKATTVSGLRKIDDLTFAATFKDFVNPGMLLFEAITAILPKEEVAKPDFTSHPVGLGPFKFVEHVEGSRVVVTRFDKYYKANKPYADGIEFAITEDYSALDVAFRAGELDATVLGSNAYVLYKADPKLSKGLIEVAELFTRHMGMNTEVPPFNDVRVRQAINYAINRDVIIEKLLKNKAFKATGWLPTSSPAFDAARKPYPYDPAKAKALLAEAGLANGFAFDVTVTQSGLEGLQAIQPFLAAVGIKANAKVVENTVLVKEMDSGNAVAWMRSAGTGPDPLAALRCFDSRVSRGGCNRTQFKDPAYDAILDQAAATLDPAAQNALLTRADGYIFEKAPVWFHNYNKAVVATQPWVHGVDGNVTEAAIMEVDSIWLDGTAPARK